ncbi:hypothetical protein K491DRAFT_77098 [Lophiostoma macrostomum CBS 122681]|uniref:Uncharacterized protein n=1 Tax=Lophiostoma macrostomum CBS 122681 TaxID=1314788 RepID=A0A6A6TN14_9PLEO|nr:hypothetical protein K491DRAFT_77098 [Lophiostoma macrostomum CBS 122681]
MRTGLGCEAMRSATALLGEAGPGPDMRPGQAVAAAKEKGTPWAGAVDRQAGGWSGSAHAEEAAGVIGNFWQRKTVVEANECEDLEGILGVDDSNCRGACVSRPLTVVEVEGPGHGRLGWPMGGRQGPRQGSVRAAAPAAASQQPGRAAGTERERAGGGGGGQAGRQCARRQGAARAVPEEPGERRARRRRRRRDTA